MNVPTGIAAVVISVRSRHRDPLDDAYRAATLVLGVTVSRPPAAVIPNGLYLQGRVSCEFRLYAGVEAGTGEEDPTRLVDHPDRFPRGARRLPAGEPSGPTPARTARG